MIDAIRSYSSSHGGRLKFNNTSQAKSIYTSLTKETDAFSRTNVGNVQKQSPLNSFLVVGGGAAAISMIIETLFSANELSKGNFSMITDIFRHAGIMGVIGGTCLGIFTLLETKVFDKLCK